MSQPPAASHTQRGSRSWAVGGRIPVTCGCLAFSGRICALRRRSACWIWPRGYRGGMAETQREPVPRVDSGELDTALAFLSFARHCVLKKADGLSDEQLRRVLTSSGTAILGLVQHLAEAERYWFGYHLAGAAWDAGREYGMTVPAS